MTVFQTTCNDKVKAAYLLDYCRDKIESVPSSPMVVSSQNLLLLILEAFNSLGNQKADKLKELLDQLMSREIQLNSSTLKDQASPQTISHNVTDQELMEMSLQNYAAVYRMITEANPQLRNQYHLVLKAFRQTQWRIDKLNTRHDVKGFKSTERIA